MRKWTKRWQYNKQFNGKTYTYQKGCKTKVQAKKYAKSIRGRYKRARVVSSEMPRKSVWIGRGATRYAVYGRLKRDVIEKTKKKARQSWRYHSYKRRSS